MMNNKKISVVMGLLLIVIIGIAATNSQNKWKHKNLKVLPKGISSEVLDKVMENWKESLGVKCSFCHAPAADSNSHHLDFSSDANPKKNIARNMFRLTAKINKKYFHVNKDDKIQIVPVINCVTCHRGTPNPR